MSRRRGDVLLDSATVESILLMEFDLPALRVPDIVEFVMSDGYLNRPRLYPRQATLLKMVFLADELLTEYDLEVIGRWTETYLDTMDESGEGLEGIVPDVLDRIAINKASGRKWFRENVLAMGRRGSKGHMGGLATSYVIWNYMAVKGGDPQKFYGIDRDKQLTCQVFAGKKEQARQHQWKDIVNVLMGGPCFAPYLSRPLGETLSLYSPHDRARLAERRTAGIDSAVDMATFLIEARESTTLAARGPAAFALLFDEMAHVVRAVASADAEQVYEAATPALDQFGKDGFMWEPSSPWQRTGQFYANYRKSLERDEDGSPSYPEVFMAQLPSWDIYEDWERTTDPALKLVARNATVIPLSPAIHFPAFTRAIQTYDAEMERLERANPETFAVERRARWASVLDAYLSADRIATLWHPWPDEEEPLLTQRVGVLNRTYRAHGDPSVSGANFAFGVAHIEWPSDHGGTLDAPQGEWLPNAPLPPVMPHVVFDMMTVWMPQDFEGGRIDYESVMMEIATVMDSFMPAEMSFDQFNAVMGLQYLQKHAASKHYPKRVSVFERTATAPLNWATYETFKTALGLGLVHIPRDRPVYDLLDAELQFLQRVGHNKVDHPTTGPVQTKDCADVVAIITHDLIGPFVAAFVGQALGDLAMRPGVEGGVLPFGGSSGIYADQDVHGRLSSFGAGRRLPQMPTTRTPPIHHRRRGR